MCGNYFDLATEERDMSRAYIGLAAIILFEILVLFIGCQGGKSGPVLPDIAETGPSPELTPFEQEWQSQEKTDSPPALWGFHQVSYDSHTGQIETVPLRGPMFAANVVNFLQPPMGSSTGVTVGVLDDSTFYTDGRIDVRIILHHPFPGQDVYTGFDVCGIFITEGSESSAYNSNLRYANPSQDPVLLNPDGYTRWMNPSEFLTGDIFGYEPGFWGTSESSENSGFVAGATLNPYRYFAQYLGPNDDLHEWLDDPSNIDRRGIFPAGTSCSRDYELEFPIINNKHVFIFNYAVMANWEPPTVEPPNDPITDFPPDANARWPLHIFATDNSNTYYTEDDAGGNISVDLEIFDWDAFSNPKGVPGEVSGFVLWSDEPLIDGGWAEIMDTEVEWNSGFTASTSVATIDLIASPAQSGEIPLWIEIQSSNPSTYDQGLGADVPGDPLSAYCMVMVDVKTCPKAGSGTIDDDGVNSGEFLDDVTITGDGFVDGPDLGSWLELIDAGGEAGETEPYQVHATDVHFIDENTITADFDLTNAPFGDYGLGCTNGCGTVTEPEENFELSPVQKLKIKLPKPMNIGLATNRHGQYAEPLSFVQVTWNPVPNALYYRLYAKFYDINGNPLGQGNVIATATTTDYTINLQNLPNGTSGIVEIWVTSLPGLLPKLLGYESGPSAHGFIFLQDFEGGLGAWSTVAETSYDWRMIRSTDNCVFSGEWGLKTYGHPQYAEWVMLLSPKIPEVFAADTVMVEFAHRYSDINEDNGYQVGWVASPPVDGYPQVTGYHPLPTVYYGTAYNDTSSPALQTEFGCSQYNDNNWQGDDDMTPWYLSGLDASEILGDSIGNYITFGAAVTGYDHIEVNMDDVVILVY